MALMNRLKCQRCRNTHELAKLCDDAGLLLHKRKDGELNGLSFHSWSTPWNGFGCLNMSLKKAHELANQWCSALHEGRNPLKNVINKSER